MVAVEISKVVVVTINIIFLIFGVAALAVGIVFKVGWDKVKDAFDITTIKGLEDDTELELKTAGEAVALGAIIFGSFIIVLSFFGCVGACCRVKALLVIYAIVVLILLLAQIAVVILVGVKASETKENVSKALVKILQKNHYNEDSEDKSKPWSALFNYLECCGVNNVSDFVGNTTWMEFYAEVRPRALKNATVYNTPITCCTSYNYEDKLTEKAFNTTGCLDRTIKGEFYDRGCVDAVIDEVEDHKWIFIGVGIAIFVIEILVIGMSFFLCSRNKD